MTRPPVTRPRRHDRRHRPGHHRPRDHRDRQRHRHHGRLMRAVVLVGGFGTRLRPLTLSVPKPMLPVGHVPIIERLVANLVRGGVTEVTLALGFKPEPFVEAFPDGTCAGATLRYAVEPEPLDTAGAIRFAADAAGIDDTFVVVNGDVLTDLDVGQLVAFHRAAACRGHAAPDRRRRSLGVRRGRPRRRRSGRAVRREAGAGHAAQQPHQRRHVRARAVGARAHPAGPGGVDRTGHVPADRRRRRAVRAGHRRLLDRHRSPELYLQANLDLAAGRRPHDRCQAIATGSIRRCVGSGRRLGGGRRRGRRRRARVHSSVLLDGAGWMPGLMW